MADGAPVALLLDCFPSSICTEILARDRSTPEFWSACVRVLNNLFNIKDTFIILIHNQHMLLQNMVLKFVYNSC